jgi:CPA2 family monovalent cation:H+ antiporter-2
MHDVPRLLVDLAMVLGVGAVTSLLCKWLRLPLVLGYVLAGLVVGPHVPIPLVADVANVKTLAELGVILLMFSIGMEFSLQKLFRAGPTALLMGSIQVGLAFFLGISAGQALGLKPMETVFIGAALSISSTMVVAKLFEEHRPTPTVREAVLSVLVVQDLFAILLLTGLIAYAKVGGLSASDLGRTLLHLGLSLLVVLTLGRLTIPRLLRWVADHTRRETLLITSAGLCFVFAMGAALAGFSVALGAFLAGMLAAESGRVRTIERLLSPLRDLFTAVFFVSVGMLLFPEALWTLRLPILLLSILVILGNVLSLTTGGLLAGLPLRTSLRTGMALGQIGEFSYIILGTGIAAGVVRSDLYTAIVAVGVVTTFATPLLLKASGPLSESLESRLPAGLRASLGLYQAWAQALRQRGIRRGEGRHLRYPTLFMFIDSLALVGLMMGHRWLTARWTLWLEGRLHWGHQGAQLVVAGLLGLAVGLLVLAILRQGRILARDLAVLTPAPGPASSGRRGRHLLAGGLRMAMVLMVGLPLLALVQPFAPRGWSLAVALAVFLFTLAVQWVRARGLAHESITGTEWLLAQVRDPWSNGGSLPPESTGTLRSLRLGPHCPSLGRPLSELDLPGRAGITVVALLREGCTSVPLHPSPELRAGDLLALAGSDHALDEAEALLGQENFPRS